MKKIEKPIEKTDEVSNVCEVCKGTGRDKPENTCPQCRGTGVK